MRRNNRNAAVLVADSGSTKTDWMLLGETGRKSFQTQGLNPVLMSEEQIVGILQCELLPELPNEDCFEVFFYGAGVRPEFIGKMELAFQQAFAAGSPFATIAPHSTLHTPHSSLHTPHSTLLTPHVTLHAASDLLGAARALCGHSEGIACILGTGSNSCLFDGENIVQNTPALGYILGDEGSGASLGKRFLNALFKGILSESLHIDFQKETSLSLDEIIKKVYREPMPNRFLASFSKFIHLHLEKDEALRELVKDEFRRFFRHNIVPYQRRDLAVNFVGSIAHHYEPLLREAARDEGFEVGLVVASPIGRLADYHQSEGHFS
ncbi:MAG: ATPase [Prevotella sp.]|nr:ATPase [Prevotella sp.]